MTYTVQDVQATRNIEDAATLRAQMTARLKELDQTFEGQTLDDAAKEEFASLKDFIAQLTTRENEWAFRQKTLADLAETQAAIPATDLAPNRLHARSNIPADIYDITEYRVRTNGEPERMKNLLVDGAKKAVERAMFAHEKADQDKTKDHIFRLLDRIDDPEALARRVLGTGNPLYAPAFFRGLATEGRGLTSQMMAAIATVGTTTTGGYAVPFTLDASLILTSDGQVNPLRGISRVEQIMGNTWKGLTSAGITVSRGTEAAAITASNVAFGQPDVTVQAVKAEIQYSIESDEDWPALQSEMARVLQDAKDAEEAVSFFLNTGTPPAAGGVVGTLDAAYHVGTGGNGFGLDDIDRLTNRLPDRWEPRARYVGHRAVFTEIERLDRATGGGSVYRPLANGAPNSLNGYPRHFASAMDQDFTDDDAAILLFGDFNQFLIVDKIGMSVEVDPHVRDGNGKWTGQRALLAHWRNNSEILVESAFRLLKVGVVTS